MEKRKVDRRATEKGSREERRWVRIEKIDRGEKWNPSYGGTGVRLTRTGRWGVSGHDDLPEASK